jgi:ABC-type phosphate/phosphonate transport system substrate-binding protein
LRVRIRDVLLSLHLDQAMRMRLDLGLVDRFVPVGPESYNDIRNMLETCEAASFLEIR